MYTVGYKGKVDSVWQWDYGAYMKVRIMDILVEGNKFITINSTYSDIGYAVYEYNDGHWQPFMGGVLQFLSQADGKVESKIIAKDRIQIIQSGKAKNYELDFTNKTATWNN